MSASPASAVEFEQLFELAPVSMWLEDYSQVKALFDQWRAAGVDDFLAHVQQQPECLRQCVAAIRVRRVNRSTLELLAAPSQEALLEQLEQVFRDDMYKQAAREMHQLWCGQLSFIDQTVNYTLDGRRLDVQIRLQVLSGHEQDWSQVLVCLEDNTRSTQAAAQLALSEQHTRNLFERSPVSLWVEDFSAIKLLLDELRVRGIEDFATFIKVHPDFVGRCMEEIRVLDVNQQTLTMFGASSKQQLLAQLGSVFRDEMHDSFAEQLCDLWNGKLVQQREVVNYSLTGDPINIHLQFAVLDGHLDHWDLVLVSLVDFTARKKAENYLEYLGKHDVLTRLRNRTFYAEELNRLMRRGPWPLTVIAIDLNGLKQVNDEQGHGAGDALLRRIGEVLVKAVDAPGSTAARIGGDEFTVLLPGLDERVGQTIKDRIQTLLELNNQFYAGTPISLAMGMSSCSAGAELEQCLQQADRAMYSDKSRYYGGEHERRQAY